MSKTAKLQQKINLLRLELRMSQMVNTQLMAEVIEGNRVIGLLECKMDQLRNRIQCCEHDDSSPEELEEHFIRNFGEYLQEDPSEIQAEG